MNPISMETIDQTWQDLVAMKPGSFTDLVSDFVQEQPYLLSYLMAVDEEHLNDDERELLMFLGTVVWRIMSQQGKAPLPKATANDIFDAEDNNFNMLRNYHEDHDPDYSQAILKVLQSYNQWELLNFVINTLLEDDEEANIRENNLAVMMIYLKTVIDCLDR